MTNQIYPCLWFDGKANEAATFYCSVFSNTKMLSNNPMVSMFEIEGQKIMCLNGGPMFSINPSISFFVNCKSTDETNEIWNKLSAGGKALMPIDKYPWSERYGWMQDKFGLTWQVFLDANADKKKIIPSMLFTGNHFGQAEAAINFYKAVFDHSSIDMMAPYPAEDKNAGKVMYSEFTLGNHKMIAMDGPGAHDYTFNEAVSFVINCNNQEEIDFYWDKLTEGGSESQCGWLKDRFGVSWQVVPSVLGKLMSDPERSQRVVKAFMQMKKFDIEALENA